MNANQAVLENRPFILQLGPLSQKMDDHDFFELCQMNPDMRIERNCEGDIVIMPPCGGETGRINFTLNGLFYAWVESDGTGVGFDSSTGFTLPNGAKRSPDLSWVKRSRWNTLSDEERAEFPPLCPDFVVEIRSHTDTLNRLDGKMREYVENGAQLGWLIDPIEKRIYIYRPSADVECIADQACISGEPVLPGFVLPLDRLW